MPGLPPILRRMESGSEESNVADARTLADDRAAAELERFGYRQQLRRSMGAFSSFAVSFSLISIITGIFTNFGHGLREAGPAVLWTWVVAVIGQFLVALVVADLARHFPISGYGYQWASRLVGPRFGFFVGWCLLAQWLTGFPAICKTFAVQLSQSLEHYFASPPSVAWLTVGVITLVAAIHSWGIRLAALVNDLGVIAEIAGAAAITIALFVLYALRGTPAPTFLFDATNHATGAPAGLHSLALSLLLGAWCITGFEAAADMAEETHDPRNTVPRAVLVSELSSGIGGFLLLAAFLLSISDLTAIQASKYPLLDVIRSRAGAAATSAFLLLILVSIFACGVASMAATTRLVFALARDNMLPGSGFLSRVQTAHQTPRNAILSVWLLTCLVVLALERLAWLDVITSVATVAGYLGYGGIALAALAGLRAAVGRQAAGRKLTALAALAWTLLVVVALVIPSSSSDHPHAPLLAASVALGVGALLYFSLIAKRIDRGEAGPPRPIAPV